MALGPATWLRVGIVALAIVVAPLPGPWAQAAALYDSAYVGESAFPSLAPGESAELTVFFQNAATGTWTLGRIGPGQPHLAQPDVSERELPAHDRPADH